MIVTAACFLVLAFTATAFAVTCTDFGTPGTALFDCAADYNTDPKSVCSGDCKDELLKYADECLGDLADTYKDTLNTVCRGKGDNGSAEDDATRMGATLFSTISALLVAVFAALY